MSDFTLQQAQFLFLSFVLDVDFILIDFDKLKNIASTWNWNDKLAYQLDSQYHFLSFLLLFKQLEDLRECTTDYVFNIS